MATTTSGSTLLGAAAEHFVMSQLLRRELIAALAPAGVPDVDILVSTAGGEVLSAVQVKARRNLGRDGGWHLKKKHASMTGARLYYCLVDFGDAVAAPAKSWIVPSEIISDVLLTTHQAWLAQPGKGGKPHNDHNMRRLLPDYSRLSVEGYGPNWMDPYAEAWHLLGAPAA